MSAKEPNGQVVERRTAKGVVYALRFRAYGKRQYLTFGSTSEGWTRGAPRRSCRTSSPTYAAGMWRRSVERGPDAPRDPTFHEFASEWLAARAVAAANDTVLDYRWQLTHHLLPFFAEHRLSQITIKEVDRYRRPRSVRASRRRVDQQDARRLRQILEVAVEYELIARNPARSAGASSRPRNRDRCISTRRIRSARCLTPRASLTPTAARTSARPPVRRDTRLRRARIGELCGAALARRRPRVAGG